MIKKTVLIALLLPATTSAESLDTARIEQIKGQLKSMQSCITKMDKTEMKKIGGQAKALDVELKALCTAGHRDEAQQKAISFGKEIAASPAMAEMKKCGDQMTAMLPELIRNAEDDSGNHHVCDR